MKHIIGIGTPTTCTWVQVTEDGQNQFKEKGRLIVHAILGYTGMTGTTIMVNGKLELTGWQGTAQFRNAPRNVWSANQV